MGIWTDRALKTPTTEEAESADFLDSVMVTFGISPEEWEEMQNFRIPKTFRICTDCKNCGPANYVKRPCPARVQVCPWCRTNYGNTRRELSKEFHKD